MARGHENLIPFDKRTEDEQRKMRSDGGKASGETRRKKADLRRTLNALLTTEIDSPEWTPFLESVGIDSTLEAAINAAMIKEALGGNVKAYLAIKDVLGQTSKSEADLEEQQLKVDILKSRAGVQEEEMEDDGFMDALNATAAEDWDEQEEQTGV